VDGAWVTGVFDRVVLRRDTGGRVTGASVYDFKTDRVEPGDEVRAASRHAGQLAIYRKAAAALTGLPESRVTCALVLTAARRVIEVGAD